ncbi:MAG: SbcC/MukB-like Walker B domain-containing protein [Bacillota bacterium]
MSSFGFLIDPAERLETFLSFLQQGAPTGWRPNRIIFRNFWFFDREEFHWHHGRLFLGGQNAAGKSTVLSMAVPLLLDGNKSEDRLNTFGGQGRHMAYYVTGSPPDDTGEAAYFHQARISYLALEFIHPDGDRYLTFGQGLHHDRSGEDKSVRSWGFVIRDGRRIGRNGFDLVREQNLSLSRADLKKLLEGGGELFDTNREYKREVNRLLFGFKDLDDFDALIELLLQIRRPKLTKEVRPRDVAGILTQSLPPVDEGVMQITATSLDHIDQTTQNLERLADQVDAVLAIERATQTVFRRMAEVAAAQFIRAAREADQAAAELQAKAAALAAARAEQAEALATRRSCEQRLTELTEERRELEGREGVQAAARLSQVEQEIAGREQELERLREQLQGLERSIQERRRQIAAEERSWEQIRAEGLESVAGAVESAREARWEAAAHWAGEQRQRWENLLVSRPEPALAEAIPQASVAAAVAERLAQIEQVRQAVVERDQAQARWQAAAAVEDQALTELMAAEAATTAAANQLESRRQEAAEALYAWAESATALRVDADALEPVAQSLRRYIHGHAGRPRQALELLRPALALALEAVDTVAMGHRERLRAVQQDLTQLRQQRAHLEEALPEPPRSAEQERARAALAAAAIPFSPLYELVEPDEETGAEYGRLEQALAEMGLLDALVLPAERREEGLALLLAQGLSERLLLAPVGPAGADLLAQLTRQPLPDALAAIFPDGTWRHGLLAGATAPAESPRYLGRAARERFRLAELARLDAAIAAGEAQERQEQAALARLDQQRAAIQADWQRAEGLPAFDFLEQAAMEHAIRRQQVEERQGALRAAREQVALARQELEAMEARLLHLYGDFPAAEGLGLAALQRLADETRVVAAHFKDLHHHAKELLSSWQKRATQVELLNRDQSDRDERIDRREQGEVDLRRLRGQRSALQKLRDDPRVQSLFARLAEIDQAIPALDAQQRAADRTQAIKGSQVAELEREMPAFQQRADQTAAEATAGRQRLADAVRAYPTLEPHQFDPTDDEAARRVGRALLNRWHERPNLVEEIQKVQVSDQAALSKLFEERRPALRNYFPEMHPGEPSRLVQFTLDGLRVTPFALLRHLEEEQVRLKNVLQRDEAALFERHLLQDVGREVRRCLLKAKDWVDEINEKLERYPLRNDERVWLDWSPKSSEHELGGTIARQAKLLWIEESAMTREQRDLLRSAFQEEIRQIRDQAKRGEWRADLFRERLAEVLDYRTWFRFRLYVKGGTGGRQEVTDTVHNARSGSERALVLLLPLLAGLSVRYDNASPDAPRLLALDEGFAGIDAVNSRQLIRFLTALNLTWVISSEKLPALTEDLPGASFYAMLREGTTVATRPFIWDGRRLRDGETEVTADG